MRSKLGQTEAKTSVLSLSASQGRFVTGKFAVKDRNGHEQYYSGMAASQREQIMNTKLLVYVCEGDEPLTEVFAILPS
jgi:hypothetical protein